jgi:hypothetical protein
MRSVVGLNICCHSLSVCWWGWVFECIYLYVVYCLCGLSYRLFWFWWDVYGFIDMANGE